MPKLGPMCLNKRTRLGDPCVRAGRNQWGCTRRWWIFREKLLLHSLALPLHMAILLPMYILEVWGLIFTKKRTLICKRLEFFFNCKGEQGLESALQQDEVSVATAIGIFNLILEDQVLITFNMCSSAQRKCSVNVCCPDSEFFLSLWLLSTLPFVSSIFLNIEPSFRYQLLTDAAVVLTLAVNSPRWKVICPVCGFASNNLGCYRWATYN